MTVSGGWTIRLKPSTVSGNHTPSVADLKFVIGGHKSPSLAQWGVPDTKQGLSGFGTANAVISKGHGTAQQKSMWHSSQMCRNTIHNVAL